MRCPYCERPIGIGSLCLDHRRPVARGGSLALSNLDPICSDCNNLKGGLTGREFLAFLAGMRTFHPDAQRDVFRRMRAGSMGIRLRFHVKPKSAPSPQPSTLNIEEDF